MKIIDFLEMLFPRQNDASSRQKAKERLQVVLAHDRATVTPDTINSMRKEILDVVARYVDIDKEEMEFGLENSQRATSLIAHFPIRNIKRNIGKRTENEDNLSKNKETEKLNDELLEL